MAELETLTTRSPAAIAVEETLLWLCGIPSPIGEEEAICDAVQARLARLPLPQPIRRYGQSIVVPLVRSSEVRPHIALVGHLDTVRTENGPARAEDGRIYGAGAADMKAGLAVMIVLAETIGELAKCDLTLVFYAREEGPYVENELGPVLAKDPELSKIDLAICMEPSDNRLHLGCCGALQATVLFEGKTAHSARPWEGVNAITKAAPFLSRLAALKPIDKEIEGLVFRTVTTVTVAKGGRGRNIVPDQFAMNVNHRFVPTTTVEEAKRYVLDLVGPDALVEFTDISPAAMPNASHPLVGQLVLAGARGPDPKQAWTDVGRFAASGVAAINFGPGENAQAHQKNESTDAALLSEGYRIMRTWLTSLKV